ncbi:hypothetical protein [Streptomyces sp. ISL-100]|uniref:glycine-rich domain-containing protein n=1 Tax=Streptomyces sp. ISL-100 TaxID=2819173 RepID=UPI001BE99B64|nr:hypothetical protein [Streptomyces sp. ISL-100]MBT2400772.1 hypothetical protein [Streptomyces sp. ISL-100]
MSITTEPPPVTRDVRDLISPEDLVAVTATVQQNNPGMELDVAELITLEAIKFEAACAAHPGAGLAPSRVVDEGWHALILHTRVKASLAARLGMFVHHVPEAPNPGRRDPDALTRSQEAIKAAGYTPEPAMWVAPTDTSIPVAAECQRDDDGGTIVITKKP